MPVEQRSRISQVTGVFIAIGAVLLAVGASWGLLRLASGGDGPVQIQLGDEDFDAGQINRISAQIAEEGPVLYSDVSGRGQRQPIWVNHFGDDPEQQWYVFSAIAPGAEEGCFLAWNEDDNLFDERRPDPEDPRARGELCRAVTYSATGEPEPGGEALEQFTWSIDSDDNLIIEVVPREDEDDDSGDSEGN